MHSPGQRTGQIKSLCNIGPLGWQVIPTRLKAGWRPSMHGWWLCSRATSISIVALGQWARWGHACSTGFAAHACQVAACLLLITPAMKAICYCWCCCESHIAVWALKPSVVIVLAQIGVFQGKLFIALTGFSHPSEPLLAADW